MLITTRIAQRGRSGNFLQSYFSAGNNGYGQTAINNNSLFPTVFTGPVLPYTGVTQPDSWSKWSMRYNTIAAVKSNGTLWVAGMGSFGQLGLGDTGNADQMTQVFVETYVGSGVYKTDWIDVGVGTEHVSALDSQGNIWCAGRNDIAAVIHNGTDTGNITTFYNTSLTDRPFNEESVNFKSFSVGHRFVYGIDDAGDAWSWGNNGSRQLGRASPQGIIATITVTNGGSGYTPETTTITISAPTGTNQVQAIGTPVIVGGVIASITIAKCGSGYVDGSTPTVTITSSGSGTGAVATATRGGGVANPTQDTMRRKIDPPGPWVKVFAGGYHGGALHSDGSLWMWGLFSSGQRGNASAQTPEVIPTIGGIAWVDAYMGENSTFLRNANGEVYAMGVNADGQLGIGNVTSPVTTPTKLDGSWRLVSIDWAHAGGVKTDGTLWTWGTNVQSQLGMVITGNLANVGLLPASAAVGTIYTVNVTSPTEETQVHRWDGSAWVVMGNTARVFSPVSIGTDTSWINVVTGIYSSTAIKLAAAT